MSDRAGHRQRSSRRCGRGFTLMEMIVVTAIVALLISLLMPVLKKVREHSRDTQCRSNLRQLGMLTFGYTHDFRGQLPWSELWSRTEMYLYLGMKDYASSDHCHKPDLLLWHCPTNTGRVFWWSSMSYGVNGFFRSPFGYAQHYIGRPSRLSRIPNPGQTVNMVDGGIRAWQQFFGPDGPTHLVMLWTRSGYGQDSGFWHGGTIQYNPATINDPVAEDWGGGTCNILFLDGHVSDIRPLPAVEATLSRTIRWGDGDANYAPWN